MTYCSNCGRDVRVRLDGRLYRHWWQVQVGDAKTPCPAGETGREARS